LKVFSGQGSGAASLPEELGVVVVVVLFIKALQWRQPAD